VSPIRPLSHLSLVQLPALLRLSDLRLGVPVLLLSYNAWWEQDKEVGLMKGTLRERTPGVWQVRAYAGRDEQGRPIQLAKTVHGGRRAAHAALAALVTEIGDRGAPITGGSTVGELLDRWLEHIRPQREPGTIRGYLSTIKRIKPVLGDVQVSKLTAQHLDRAYRKWRDPKGQALSAGTVRHTHAVLASALHQAVRWELIPRAVTDLAQPPSLDTAEQTPVTLEDLQTLIHAAEGESPVLSAAIFLAAITGARREELCGLRWSDLDPANRVLTIARAVKHDVDRTKIVVRSTKTRQVRRVALDAAGLELLAEHRKRVEEWARMAELGLVPYAYILPGGRPLDPTGATPMKPDTLTEAFRRLAHKVGVKIRFHDLRHFSATRLIGAGVDVRTVAGRLGHTYPAVTLRVYAHALEEQDREAAAILGALVASQKPLGAGE
jgi:integrase